MNVHELLRLLDEYIPNPSEGLPEEVFLLISRLTPLVNVDLLIKDENNRTLLSWRDDKYTGTGWHLPGGIVRFKETLETRVKKVADIEIGTQMDTDLIPINMNQMIYEHEHDIRSHFISFLYKCFLPASFILKNKGLSNLDSGYLEWHNTCPDNLLECQKIYKNFM